MQLSYANVMATVAVFIALGGTSYLALFECDEEPGAQDVQLQAQATGAAVALGHRSLALTEWQDLP